MKARFSIISAFIFVLVSAPFHVFAVEQSSFAPVVKIVKPAVVSIQVTQGAELKQSRDPRQRSHEGPPPFGFSEPPPGLEQEPPH